MRGIKMDLMHKYTGYIPPLKKLFGKLFSKSIKKSNRLLYGPWDMRLIVEGIYRGHGKDFWDGRCLVDTKGNWST